MKKTLDTLTKKIFVDVCFYADTHSDADIAKRLAPLALEGSGTLISKRPMRDLNFVGTVPEDTREVSRLRERAKTLRKRKGIVKVEWTVATEADYYGDVEHLVASKP